MSFQRLLVSRRTVIIFVMREFYGPCTIRRVYIMILLYSYMRMGHLRKGISSNIID